MNHSEIKFIPVLRGFRALPFPGLGERVCFPNNDTLIELLRPGANPEKCELCQFELEDRIPDFVSQLLLQKYSNQLVEQFEGYEYINLMCQELGIDSQQAQYHTLVTNYIDCLFPNTIPVADYLPLVAVDMASYYSSRGLGGLGRSFKDLLQESSKDKSVDRELYLKNRFIEYKESSEYLHDLYIRVLENKGDSFMTALKYYEEETEVSRKRIKEIRRIPVKKRESRNWVRQCPYCHKWYEQIIGGNGKLRVYCDDCKKIWDTARKPSRSKKSVGFAKATDKRKRCSICCFIRIVNKDRMCSKCVTEKRE